MRTDIREEKRMQKPKQKSKNKKPLSEATVSNAKHNIVVQTDLSFEQVMKSIAESSNENVKQRQKQK